MLWWWRTLLLCVTYMRVALAFISLRSLSPSSSSSSSSASFSSSSPCIMRRNLTTKRHSSRPGANHDDIASSLSSFHADGFLAVDKPEGWSSNDVVQKIRGTLEKEARQRNNGKKASIKVGHGGTLDPMATGVLVLGVGSGCKNLGLYLKGTKAYRAVGLLGSEYDTMDRTGQVTETVDISHITSQMLEEALAGFRGTIMQRPPAFSAIKKGGKRLYELARKGETVEAEPRPVQVDRLELLPDYILPYFGLEIECGGGTYVRSLISDIARALGGRAHMAELVRTKQGPFLLKDCLPVDKWKDPKAVVNHLVVGK